MPPRPTRNPQDKPRTLTVTPLSTPQLPTSRPVGRPKKIDMPPMPRFEFTELEEAMYSNFIDSHRKEYQDLTPTDLLLLGLAACEYINYIRVLHREFEDNELITMARQAPYTPMLALLDRLSVTRRERKKTEKPEDPEAARREELLKLLG